MFSIKSWVQFELSEVVWMSALDKVIKSKLNHPWPVGSDCQEWKLLWARSDFIKRDCQTINPERILKLSRRRRLFNLRWLLRSRHVSWRLFLTRTFSRHTPHLGHLLKKILIPWGFSLWNWLFISKGKVACGYRQRGRSCVRTWWRIWK